MQHVNDRKKQELLSQDIIFDDETTLQVLQEAGNKAESQSYLWLYRSGRYGPGSVLFEYQPTRSGEHSKEFLIVFKCYLVTDAYGGYIGIPDVTRVGCWAHARSGFDEAIKASCKRSKAPLAAEGLKISKDLYDIENPLEDVDPKER